MKPKLKKGKKAQPDGKVQHAVIPSAKPSAKTSAKPSPDILEVLGIAPFARLNGVSADSVLAILATVLPAVAGPVTWTTGQLGPTRLGDLNLMVPADSPLMMRLVERLTAHAGMLSQRLATKMTVFSPTAIECVLKGAFGSGLAAKLAPTASRDQTLASHQQALRSQESRILLHEDLKFDPIVPRAEAISHPEFLLEFVGARELIPSTESCHCRSALLITPRLGLERAGSEPHQAVKTLASLLAGAVAPERSAGTPRPAGRPKARLILPVNGEDLAFLQNFGGDLLRQLVWLPATPEGPPTPERPATPADPPAGRPVPDAPSALAFVQIYQSAIEHVLALRREGRQPMMQLEDESSVVQLDSRSAAFVRGVDGFPHDPGSAARALPGALAWSLGVLCQMLPNRGPSEAHLIDTALSAAERLLAAHLQRMDVLRTDQQVQRDHLMAERVLAAVAAKGAMKLREIARIFQNQKKEAIEPVLRAMVEVGLLEPDGTGAYATGAVELDDAEDALSALFRAAVVPCLPPATEIGDKAKKSQNPPRN